MFKPMNKVKNIVSCEKKKNEKDKKKKIVLLFNFPDVLMFTVRNKHFGYIFECLM